MLAGSRVSSVVLEVVIFVALGLQLFLVPIRTRLSLLPELCGYRAHSLLLELLAHPV